MDGCFFYSLTRSRWQFPQLLPKLAAPKGDVTLGKSRRFFRQPDNDFPDCGRGSHKNKPGSCRWRGETQRRPRPFKVSYDNMPWPALIGRARSCVIIKSLHFLLKSSGIRGSDCFAKVSQLMSCSKSSRVASQQLKLSFRQSSRRLKYFKRSVHTAFDAFLLLFHPKKITRKTKIVSLKEKFAGIW